MDSTTVTCPECGQENNPSVEMCTRCGAALNPQEEDVDLEDGKTDDQE